ncbi:MAG: alpha/beta hydrolase [Candidatus Didemnitutus sp.]|nr:alpha/beta hydrolase [Candidatus Didemnitutus sp.]
MKPAITPADEIMRAWQAGAQFAEVDGVRVHYRVAGDGPWLVCFHGFPTSSWDWHQLVPLLAPHRRVLVFDFPGYGLSAKPTDRDYSLLRQCDAAEALLRSLGIATFDLLAHDMGNSVACELLYRIEQRETDLELRSLTLLNGGLYMDLHRPLLTQRLLRLPVLGALVARITSWMLFRRQYPKVYARPEQFAEAHYRHQWNLLLHGGGRRTLALIAGYMRERVRRGERWLGPLHRTTLPLTVIWGREDPIAVHAIAERLVRENPRARLVTLEGVGHYPQLEAPVWVASQVLPALAAAEGT